MSYPKYDTDDYGILTYFDYEHLPPVLAEVSKPFNELAYHLVATVADNYSRAEALKTLLIAKDWAVRAALPPGKAKI